MASSIPGWSRAASPFLVDTKTLPTLYRPEFAQPSQESWWWWRITSRITMKFKEKRWKTRKCEISLSGIPHASSKKSQTTFYPFYNQILPRTKNSLFPKFCSTAVGLLSRKSNFVSKRKRNQKLTVKNFWVKLTSPREEIPWTKDPICYTKQNFLTKTGSLCLIHPLFN